jgi:hypothetical protein
VAAASCSDPLDVVGPTLQRLAHLGLIFCTLVHASNARTMAGVVVKDCLDVVGLDAEFA